MKITIHKPECFTEIGQRANNEDNLYPSVGEASGEDRLFLVCDGVGGENGGEIASAIACHYIPEYFRQFPKEVSNAEFVEKALKQARQAIMLEQDKKVMTGMSTTLTLLHFHEQGATIAHIGDSRVYQLRNGKIIHITEDHSLVNSLIKAGMITKEQGQNHPKRNVITRSLNSDDDDSDDEAEVVSITDIQAGDYFFMCTDGVLEKIDEELLTRYLFDTAFSNNAERMAAIREHCYGDTRDNFTAYLIQVASVEGKLSGGGGDFPPPPPPQPPRPRWQLPWKMIFGLLVMMVVFGASGNWIYNRFVTSNTTPSKVEKTKEDPKRKKEDPKRKKSAPIDEELHPLIDFKDGKQTKLFEQTDNKARRQYVERGELREDNVSYKIYAYGLYSYICYQPEHSQEGIFRRFSENSKPYVLTKLPEQKGEYYLMLRVLDDGKTQDRKFNMKTGQFEREPKKQAPPSAPKIKKDTIKAGENEDTPTNNKVDKAKVQ